MHELTVVHIEYLSLGTVILRNWFNRPRMCDHRLVTYPPPTQYRIRRFKPVEVYYHCYSLYYRCP